MGTVEPTQKMKNDALLMKYYNSQLARLGFTSLTPVSEIGYLPIRRGVFLRYDEDKNKFAPGYSNDISRRFPEILRTYNITHFSYAFVNTYEEMIDYRMQLNVLIKTEEWLSKGLSVKFV